MNQLKNNIANYKTALKYLKSVNSPRKTYYNMPLPTENQWELYSIFWNILPNNIKKLAIIRKSNVNKALANFYNKRIDSKLVQARKNKVARRAVNKWKYLTGLSAEIRRALANHAENKGLPRKNNAAPFRSVRVPSPSPRRRQRTPMFTNNAVEAAYRRRYGLKNNN